MPTSASSAPGYAGLTAARRLSQAGKVGRRARGARPGRRPHLDRAARRRHAGRPRRRAGWRRSTTPSSAWPREIGVSTYKTWVQGRPPARRRRPHPPLHRPHPEDQPARRRSRIALAQLKIDRMAKQVPARRAVDRAKRGRGVGRAVGGVVARALGHPHHDRPRPLRDGGARPVHRRPRRRVVPPPPVPRPRATAASTRCSRSRRARRRTWSTAAPAPSPGGWPTSSATRCGCERAGPVDHPARRPRRRRRRRRHGVGPPRRRRRPARARARDRLRPRAARRPPRRSTATRSPVPRRRRSSSTTSRSGGPTASAARPSEPGSAAEVTLDAVAGVGRPGVIASFTFGPVAERVDALDPAERRRRCSTRSPPGSGRARRRRSEFIETAWWKEEWTRGCSMAHFPPGHPHPLRAAAARAVRAGALGRHRDVDHLARRHRRRRALRRARRGRDPQHLSAQAASAGPSSAGAGAHGRRGVQRRGRTAPWRARHATIAVSTAATPPRAMAARAP